jgi:hypothetical protein
MGLILLLMAALWCSNCGFVYRMQLPSNRRIDFDWTGYGLKHASMYIYYSMIYKMPDMEKDLSVMCVYVLGYYFIGAASAVAPSLAKP